MTYSNCSPTFTALTKLKEYKLLQRLRSNHAPVASERVDLDQLVSHAVNELAQYDETIARLHEMIVDMSNEKKKLNRQIDLAGSLLAPIRAIPPEILRNIFLANRARNVIKSGSSTDTVALWNDISLVIETDSQYHPRHVSLTERLLTLSASSHLSIDIDSEASDLPVPPVLPLLCEQAYRWQKLSGVCPPGAGPILDALSSIRGHLRCLHTFQVLGAFDYCSLLVEGAPKLRTLLLDEIDARSTAIPWNQIVELGVHDSSLSNIIESLPKLPNIMALKVDRPHGHENEHGRLVLTKLNYLSFELESDTNEMAMASLLGILTCPKLESLRITALGRYKTNQSNLRWMSEQLPSFISRSSAVITSFTLDNTWMCPSDLIALLQIMPALTVLSISDPYIDDVMITDEFLSSIHCCHQDRQPLLTHLQSLTLRLHCGLSLFNIYLFVEVIHSRWKPFPAARLVEDSPEEVACLRTVELEIVNDRVDTGMLQSLMMLRKRGLNISVYDVDGDAF